MSYNIDHCDMKGTLTIQAKDVRRILKKLKDQLPEACFLEDLDTTEDGEIEINDDNFAWHGEGSGHAYHDHFETVMAATRGKATIIFIWEGGDSKSAVKINDGVVTKAKVKMIVE